MEQNFRYKTDKSGLAVLGDTHGNWASLANFCDNYTNFCIVHVGDAGIGFNHPLKEGHLLRKVNRKLHETNNEVIVIRGNHDCPKRFIGKWIEEEILFADDYHILEFKEKKIQLVGGAISIDRSERVVNLSWWANEEVKFKPERIEKVDILITHAAPTNAGLQKADCNDMVRHYHGIEASQGGDLFGELESEQKIIQQISDLSECKEHYFGHMHHSHYYTDPSNGRKYVCLNIDEFREIK